jgi:hypothetical protein
MNVTVQAVQDIPAMSTRGTKLSVLPLFGLVVYIMAFDPDLFSATSLLSFL